MNTGISFYIEKNKRVGETLRGAALAIDKSLAPLSLEKFRLVRPWGGSVSSSLQLHVTQSPVSSNSVFVAIEIGEDADEDVTGIETSLKKEWSRIQAPTGPGNIAPRLADNQSLK